MEIGPYLAMTASEFAGAEQLPPKTAWMACQFSPYGTGLVNLPPALSPGSLLILSDQFPPAGHDPARVAVQLRQTVEKLGCAGALLDFQRPVTDEAMAMAEYLVSSLPCPVGVSESHGANLDCPVFLSPCPHHIPLAEHLAPWTGRAVWLDLARDAQMLTLTKNGCVTLPLPPGELPENGHRDKPLHCHYRTETSPDSARFTLWRTKEDLEALAQEAETLGVKTLVGLYQELHCANTEKHPSR